ncbi:MAG: PAS domain-containing protein [Mesorhizobium sp.]|nr:PAS domain-containing sensor histidine kinase [Mesorhizobium sp.]MCO5161851.1 PAS domain-containing protein [Mesorhizobium sp.]
MTETDQSEGWSPTSSSVADGADRASLIRALTNVNVAILAQDASLVYRWVENPPAKWSADGLVGRVDADIFSRTVADDLTRLKQLVLADRQRRHTELEISTSEDVSCFEIWLDPLRDLDGTAIGVVTTATEITEQRLREQTLRTLLREVSHRSKNLLAIIQSIAAQTGRYAGTIDQFLSRFRGRLQSLSSSQDLVTSSNWRGADLSQLVAGQVARYCAEPGRNLVMDGETPYLNPNAALHVGLALHELAVNSVSYGALSSPEGQVRIEVRPLPNGEMELVWSEPLTRADATLERKRFGTVALERVVPSSLNSSATLYSEAGRLFYRLILPADSFHTD